MIPSLRQSFNNNFTEAKYRNLLDRLDALCGVHIEFRICETPLFLPRAFMEDLGDTGSQIISQLVSDTAYLEKAEQSIPPDFRVPNETPHPLFVAVDFGITKDSSGNLVPKLIELQGFPTLFAYQMALAEHYRAAYGLSSALHSLLGNLDSESYYGLFRKAVLGSHKAENVILMDLDPKKQKTRADFILTERACGIATVNIRDVIKRNNVLFYRRNGSLVPIHRIYNRTIVDELIRAGAQLPFSFRDELAVEWAGHPNWFFKLSKFSIPFIDHAAVPKTFFVSAVNPLPVDLDHWVLKPLYSFAGSGVIIAPTKEEIEAIPNGMRDQYILQERVSYEGMVATPHGATKAEVRIMYIWLDRLIPVNSLVRMGRGKMMGVDHNRDMAWVGSSACFTS